MAFLKMCESQTGLLLWNGGSNLFTFLRIIFACIVLFGVIMFPYNCRTLTSPVKLIKCLQAIKNHAFVASEYPVVITFEDHLTPDLQDKVALVSEKIYNTNFWSSLFWVKSTRCYCTFTYLSLYIVHFFMAQFT